MDNVNHPSYYNLSGNENGQSRFDTYRCRCPVFSILDRTHTPFTFSSEIGM